MALENEIAILERQLSELSSNDYLKSRPDLLASAKKRLDGLKVRLEDASSKGEARTKVAISRTKVKQMPLNEFKAYIKQLAKKPQYKFLKGLTTGQILDDKKRVAKPVGWRFSGRENMKKPTKAEVREGKKDGSVYYENRSIRSDVSRAIRLETGGNIETELENFDLKNLDTFERREYDHFVKQSTKTETLQLLINNVEGDYSQLSTELSEIAEKYYPEEYIEYAKGSTIKGIDVKEGMGAGKKTWVVSHPKVQEKSVYFQDEYSKGESKKLFYEDVLRLYKMANGGAVENPSITITQDYYDEKGDNSKKHPLKYSVNYLITFDGGDFIELTGTLKPHHTGRDYDYEFEVDYFADQKEENYYDENSEKIEKEILDKFYTKYKKGGGVGSEVYIEFLNKKKGYQKDVKYFKSYEQAVNWARKNFDKFNTDMIKHKFEKGGKTRANRPSPSISATSVSVGTQKTGNDGNIYEAKAYKNGVQRWVRVGWGSEQKEKSKSNVESKLDYMYGLVVRKASDWEDGDNSIDKLQLANASEWLQTLPIIRMSNDSPLDDFSASVKNEVKGKPFINMVGQKSYYVDPQGYDYARYIADVTGFNNPKENNENKIGEISKLTDLYIYAFSDGDKDKMKEVIKELTEYKDSYTKEYTEAVEFLNALGGDKFSIGGTFKGGGNMNVENCERCNQPTGNATTMSMFNEDVICMSCKEKEKQHPDYNKAVDTDNAEIKKGNYNFKGIGKMGTGGTSDSAEDMNAPMISGTMESSMESDEMRKGGNVKSIEKRVAEANAMIKEATEKKLDVVDETGTWQSPMKYKPIKYSNGVLYVEYEELDLYLNNRKGVKSWVTKKDKTLKGDFGFNSSAIASAQTQVLTQIIRMYRKVLLNYSKYGYENGGTTAGLIGTKSGWSHKRKK